MGAETLFMDGPDRIRSNKTTMARGKKTSHPQFDHKAQEIDDLIRYETGSVVEDNRLQFVHEEMRKKWAAETALDATVEQPEGTPAQSMPPPWILGEIEPPAGEKDMGGWTRGIYTAEQMERLGVDEDGK